MQQSNLRQRGASLIGILAVLAIAVFLGTAVLKLAPHYMQFATIKSVMNDARKDVELNGGGTNALLSGIDNRLYVNGVNVVTRKDFKLKREKGGNVLSVAYEVREHLAGNLDAVMTFSHQVKINQE
jgi:hypothetical protein